MPQFCAAIGLPYGQVLNWIPHRKIPTERFGPRKIGVPYEQAINTPFVQENLRKRGYTPTPPPGLEEVPGEPLAPPPPPSPEPALPEPTWRPPVARPSFVPYSEPLYAKEGTYRQPFRI